MDFDEFRRERRIRRVLRDLCEQRVAMVLQPGDVRVIEKAVKDTADTDAALKTCHLRGWVEILENALPHGNLNPDGSLPTPVFDKVRPLYRITESGWAVIHRTHLWLLVTVLISVLSFLVSTLSFWVAIRGVGHGP